MGSSQQFMSLSLPKLISEAKRFRPGSLCDQLTITGPVNTFTSLIISCEKFKENGFHCIHNEHKLKHRWKKKSKYVNTCVPLLQLSLEAVVLSSLLG